MKLYHRKYFDSLPFFSNVPNEHGCSFETLHTSLVINRNQKMVLTKYSLCFAMFQITNIWQFFKMLTQALLNIAFKIEDIIIYFRNSHGERMSYTNAAYQIGGGNVVLGNVHNEGTNNASKVDERVYEEIPAISVITAGNDNYVNYQPADDDTYVIPEIVDISHGDNGENNVSDFLNYTNTIFYFISGR